ncbi:MAG: hypothetical protein A2Y23_03585 [Clostridiales bacterium GWB2_37_7]|nr:MAG: hypothetical protein A2Y23_03585 [Clostridiales bacterium GWB2_37_7]
MNWKCENCGNNSKLKLEAEFAVDPIWCEDCGSAIDLYTFPLTSSLKEDLLKWGNDYGKWIDFETDSLVINGIELEEEFNKNGNKLAERIKGELGEKFTVTYSPSTSASMYYNYNNL